MARCAVTIREMGEKVCWLLVQQTLGMKDAKALSDFMSGKVAVMLFARASLPERLCATAAVRQMGGSTIYQGIDGGQWREDVSSFQAHLFPILSYFLDCLYIYGYPANLPQITQSEFPVINCGGGNDSHPAHALADIACMIKTAKHLEHVHAAWVGGRNATLVSLVEASVWFPFTLNVSLPNKEDEEFLQLHAKDVGAKVNILSTPKEAVTDCDFIFAGRKPEIETPENAAWSITPQIVANARPNAHLLLSATPTRAIPVSSELFSGARSLLVKQAQYRLCVHKRILHWVFGVQE